MNHILLLIAFVVLARPCFAQSEELIPLTGEASNQSDVGSVFEDCAAGSRKLKPRVLEFYAAWAEPCVRLKPVIERLKGEYGGEVDFVSYDVDDPSCRKIIDKYEVSPIPTLVFLNEKNEVMAYSIGCCSETRIIDKNMSKILPIPIQKTQLTGTAIDLKSQHSKRAKIASTGTGTNRATRLKSPHANANRW